MGVATFPAATTDLSSLQKLNQSITVASNASVVDTTYAFQAGVYTVTCISSTIAKVEFWNGNTLVTTATTASGTVTVSIATAGTKLRTWIDTGTSIVVNVTQTGQALAIGSNALSGTLDTLTTSGTYNTISNNGYLYVIAIGGGGGGACGTGAGGNGASGGGSGGVASGIIASTAGISYTVGNGGAGGNLAGTNTSNATNGNTTVFATNISAQGGAKGNTGGNGNVNDYQATPGGAYSFGGTSQNISVNPTYGHARLPTFTNTARAGFAGNVGTGGPNSQNTQALAAGTGYGSGGGTTNLGNAGAGGGAGAPGVIYVLRDWS
jgi:hypothetical protein